MTVIDVHTHMLNDAWVERLTAHGGRYSIKRLKGQRVVHYDGAPFMTLMDDMFDYTARIKAMNRAKVDMAVVSLTLNTWIDALPRGMTPLTGSGRID